MVGEALEHLRRLGYLDDGALAMSLRRQAQEVKLLGSGGARLYLRSRGIAREVAEEALEGYDELAGARRLIERKMKAMRGRTEAEQKRRLSGMLQRRGYSRETVRKSLFSSLKER